MQGVREIKMFEDQMNLIQQIVNESFQALISFCQGPCEQVQVAVASHGRIYGFINWFTENLDAEHVHVNSFYCLTNSISQFLLSVLEGDTSEIIALGMLNSLRLNGLVKIATEIYFKYIKGQNHQISMERSDVQNTERSNIITTGYNISILFLQFQHRFPLNPRVTLLFQTDSENVHENIEDNEAYNYQEAIIQNLKSFWQKFMNFFRKSVAEDPESARLKEAHFFFASTISSVEIQYRSTLCKLFFRIPPMCRFLTRKSRDDIALKVSRKSYQEKIEDFFDKTKIYEFEMKYQQSLGRYPMLEKIVSYWNLYGFIAFIFVIIINLTMLLNYTEENYLDREGTISDFLYICGSIQLLAAISYLFSYSIEYFPVIVQREFLRTNFLTMSDSNKFQRVKGTLLMKQVISAGDQIDKATVNFGLRFIFKDFQMVYCIIYLLISLISWFNPLIYSILLLDLVKRNATLINILKSISLNYMQILLTLLFGLFIEFAYATIYLLAFSDYFNTGNKFYCTSLSVCFFTLLDSGTRAGGGVGDILNPYLEFDVRTVFRLITDVSYFIIVIIVLLNIIFGIIIDTFAELRDQRNELMKDLHENCFICGNSRFQFELKRISWKLHIHLHHSLHSYLAFIVYIRQKDISKCNGVEIYTKEKIFNNDVSFFPRTSIELQKFEKEFKDSQEKLYKKYVRKLNTLKASLRQE